MNLPNRITLARILLIPVFIVLFYLEELLSGYNYLAAGIVFSVAAATDFVDGQIARKRGLVTNLGKFLDPIADKVLVSTAFILILTRPMAFEVVGEWGIPVAGVLVALILARELIVSGFRMIAAGQNIVLAADNIGKIKAWMQDFALAALIIATSFLGTTFGTVAVWIGHVSFIICAVLTVWSGIHYIVKNRAVLKS